MKTEAERLAVAAHLIDCEAEVAHARASLIRGRREDVLDYLSRVITSATRARDAIHHVPPEPPDC